MNTFIRFLYAILIAAAVVAFVGVGIYTFYPAPTSPNYPTVPLEKGIAQPVGGTTPSQTAQDTYQKQLDAYNANMTAYQRNVSIILACFAVAIIGLGLWLHSRSEIIGEGLSLGGIGTAIYSVVMAGMADDRIMRFIAVTIFLAGTIVVVYTKFKETPAAKQSARRRA